MAEAALATPIPVMLRASKGTAAQTLRGRPSSPRFLRGQPRVRAEHAVDAALWLAASGGCEDCKAPPRRTN